MLVSRRWLEAFLNRPLEVREVADRLAMLGAPVDAIESLHAILEQIVVARVSAVIPHPNADRLRVCTVEDGAGTWQVVCGAPNVVAGGRYPFARMGTTLPGGLTIAQRKLRGEVSQGMLCSGRELELSDDHDGLLTLDTDAAPGTPLLDVLPVRDDRLDVDVTPNRPDLLGHKGVARELAAALGIPFRLPVIPGSRGEEVPASERASGVSGTTGKNEGGVGVQVAVEPGSGCERLLVAVVRGVVVGPSPLWLRQRLEAAGVRSINNVVDATNYVMLELGHPLHAYDLATLSGPMVQARASLEGETVVTLDGTRRILTQGMTVIADAERAIGIAGVMGGEATEVRETTTDLVVECAWFEPPRIRATRRSLGLSTEASYRFERGVDLQAASEALRRGLEVLLTVAGGSVAGRPIDIWPAVRHPARIFLRVDRVARVLGVTLPVRAIEDALVAIGATVVAKPADGRLAVDVPGWRPDLEAEIDLIEEVARIYGYDRLPSDLGPFRLGGRDDAPDATAADRVRAGLVPFGLWETLSLPLCDDSRGVAVANPLSSNHGQLRSAILPGLLRQVEANWAGHQGTVRLFEVGTVFHPGTGALAPPQEELHVAAVVTGARSPAHWTSSGKGDPVDIWDLKGLFEAVVLLANPAARVQVASGEGWVAVDEEGRLAGHATPLRVDAPAWADPVFGLEVTVSLSPPGPPAFRPWPSTPAAQRDLALILPSGVTAEKVSAGLRKGGGRIVESVTVVDEFRGAGIAPGQRSVAFRLRFRDPERTLREQEIDRALERARQEVEETLGIVLRTS